MTDHPGWAIIDGHVIPVDVTGQMLAGHELSPGCACRPIAERDGPLDQPVLSHREPAHPGSKYELDA